MLLTSLNISHSNGFNISLKFLSLFLYISPSFNEDQHPNPNGIICFARIFNCRRRQNQLHRSSSLVLSACMLFSRNRLGSPENTHTHTRGYVCENDGGHQTKTKPPKTMSAGGPRPSWSWLNRVLGRQVRVGDHARKVHRTARSGENVEYHYCFFFVGAMVAANYDDGESAKNIFVVLFIIAYATTTTSSGRAMPSMMMMMMILQTDICMLLLLAACGFLSLGSDSATAAAPQQ